MRTLALKIELFLLRKSQEERQMQKGLLEGIQRGETVLEARGITKRFPGVVANEDKRHEAPILEGKTPKGGSLMSCG